MTPAEAHADRQTKNCLAAQRYRARQTTIRTPRPRTPRVSRKPPEKLFVGVDGEGCGLDAIGRQRYVHFQCGGRSIHNADGLKTAEVLTFILGFAPGFIHVGFAFSYDVTMILRDLEPDRVSRLMKKEPGQRSGWVYWKGFALEYLPRNYLRVARLQTVLGKETIVKGSTRTIYDVFGCFQGSFLNAIKAHGIGKEHWRMIARNKANRAKFQDIGPEEQEYCRIECQLLAELMETFRGHAHAAGIRPRFWSGAGKLATSLHETWDTPKRADVRRWLGQDMLDLADAGYYGGRFEISVTGDILGRIYEYDINSAYPAAMLHLPCVEHGRWYKCGPAEFAALKPGTLYLARCYFLHPPGNLWCGLPIRKKDGRLIWPIEGNGVYWSEEIDSARQLGAEMTLRTGYAYEKRCDCDPLGAVEAVYRYRLALKTAKDGSDIPLKLAINSLYGKLAQRIGGAPYQNPLWAGLITARTRALLNRVIAQDPDSIVMAATDALYSTKPLDVPMGDQLGQWGHALYEGIHIVQPGVYWCRKGKGWDDYKKKTRGFGLDVLTKHADNFRRAWDGYAVAGNFEKTPPKVSIRMRQFIGLKLAHHRGKPETAGMWIDEANEKAERQVSYQWTDKRTWRVDAFGVGAVRHYPLAGGRHVHTHIYTSEGKLKAGEEWDDERIAIDDQPDHAEMIRSTFSVV